MRVVPNSPSSNASRRHGDRPAALEFSDDSSNQLASGSRVRHAGDDARVVGDDILLLAEAFLAECATTVGRPAAGLSEDARDRLVRHSWPGNVRELRNAIERAVILCEGGLMTGEHLPITVTAPKLAQPHAVGVPAAASTDALKLSVVERDVIEKALASARNNKSKAAKLLGVPRGQSIRCCASTA